MNARARQLTICHQLADGTPWPSHLIEDKHRISAATVKRDIAELRAMGADIRATNLGYRLDNWPDISYRTALWLALERDHTLFTNLELTE